MRVPSNKVLGIFPKHPILMKGGVLNTSISEYQGLGVPVRNP